MGKLIQLMTLSVLILNTAQAIECTLPLGLKWGMTSKEITKKIAGKLTFENSSTKKDMQILGDEVRNYKGNFDGYEAENVEMEFLQEKLFSISAALSTGGSSTSQFDKLVATMTARYGEPKTPATESNSFTTKAWKFTNDTTAIAMHQTDDEGEKLRWMYVQSSVMEKAQKENKIETEKNSPEHIFKMKFCKYPNLLAVVFYDPVPLEKNCIYSLAPQGYAITVTQSVPEGIIVGAQNGPTNGKSIFVKTKKQYADGDLIQPQFVRFTGIMKFTTVLGAQRSVNAFQWLGDGTQSDDPQ